LVSFGFEFFVGDVILEVRLGFYWPTSSVLEPNRKEQLFVSFYEF